MEMIYKVLIIATVQSHVAQFHKPLMRLLKEYGWTIHVAARNNLEEKNGLQLEYADKVFDIPFQRSPLDKRNAGAYRRLCILLNQEHYDVIHCNTPVGGILGRLAAKKARKKGTMVYYTAHGFHFYKGAPKINWLIYYPIEKLASYFTDKLITITEEDYQLARKNFHCSVYRIHGVGANSSKYFPISYEEQKERKRVLGIKGPMIVNVGELLPNKNQKAAIMAMKYILNEYPDTRLYIAGNGSEKEALIKLVEELELNNSVIFLGYTTELQSYMQICDLEIACSYREGLPLNIMEAMMCGKPIVASHNRGHNELVENGETGFLVNPDDIVEYANAVCLVLSNPRIYRNNALNKAKRYMDIVVQDELKEIYDLE